jgi:hypothetical protein
VPQIPEEIEVWEEGKIGEVLKMIKMPKPGDRINVKDITILTEIFGEETPTKPGVVVKVHHPEDPENIWEFEYGWAIQVSWSPRAITKKGRINPNAVLWAFDICEVSLA